MKNVIYNPSNKTESELPVIYGFNNGSAMGCFIGQLIAQDGTPLGSHLCSSEGYMRNDLGILDESRPDRHEHFMKHYPEGYRMEFVSYDDVPNHAGLNAAFDANKKMGEQHKGAK